MPLAADGQPPAAPLSGAARREALGDHAALPLAFTPNAGQSDSRVRYSAQGAGFGFFFTDRGLTLSFSKPGEKTGGKLMTQPSFMDDALAAGARRSVALELGFVGASAAARPVASERLAGTVNHIQGNDPEQWQTGMSTYSEITYQDLWPGIDMVFQGRGGELKYEFHVAPGADPSRIQLAYGGAEGLSVGAGGALEVKTALGGLTDSRPVSYQRRAGERVPVKSSYRLEGNSAYGFALPGGYDTSRPLVIDPGLAYSTYLGGDGLDRGNGIAVDAAGQAYVTGLTQSADFPTEPSPGAYDATLGGGSFDAYVTKLNAAGTAVVYSTYLGGGGTDEGQGIAVDGAGQAYVIGDTSSADFPTEPSPGAYDSTNGGSTDAFVAKLNAAGTALVYSTYIGGGSFEVGSGIAVDGAGQAYLTGTTASADFPTEPSPGAYDTTPGSTFAPDAFVTKLNAAGTALVYSTYLGESGQEQGNGIAVDAAGQAHVTGSTTSTNFPTEPSPGAYDETGGTLISAFVTKFNAAGTALVYSTYLGGSDGGDAGSGIALNRAGQAFVTGSTDSTDFPTEPSPGAYDETQGGTFNLDAFVTKFNAAGTALDYSTYLGGADQDVGNGIAVDGIGQAYVTGETESSDFPTEPSPGAYDDTLGGTEDAFVTKLNTAGSALEYSTYLGGVTVDAGNGIAIDGTGAAYVTGNTQSADYPTEPSPGAYDETLDSSQDAFVTKLDLIPGLPPPVMDGEMVTKGRLPDANDGKVDFAWRVDCTLAKNSMATRPIEVRWPGKVFKKTATTSVECTDDPSIPYDPATADFDTIVFEATGTVNGVPGWKIKASKVTDEGAGSGNASDFTAFTITNPGAMTVIDVSGRPMSPFPGSSQPTGQSTATNP